VSLLPGLSFQSTFAHSSKTTHLSSSSVNKNNFENMKVAVLGAGGGIGQPLSLLLKVRVVSL
jgi:5,10-methylene-tetrahydrofolate dehydrogenase/methenyl tetrahydrofolate cyclohydrolase